MTERKMTKDELIWQLYLSERSFMRHHEEQRVNASNILVAISAGLLVALGTQEIDSTARTAMSLLLTGIGLFGFMFCGKLTALLKLHAERSYRYLQVLDKEVAQVEISVLKKEADAKSKAAYPVFSRFKLSKLWSRFHIFITLTGLVFLAESTDAIVLIDKVRNQLLGA